MVSVAISWVAEATVRFETVMPAPKLAVDPIPNPDPVIVTDTAAPGTP
jgi:hypothetical protein